MRGDSGTPASASAGSPLPPPDQKAAAVQRMFGAIAPRYDLLNHLLSLNLDRRWRRKAVDRLLASGATDGTFLDSCDGTLDLSAELAGRREFDGLRDIRRRRPDRFGRWRNAGPGIAGPMR